MAARLLQAVDLPLQQISDPAELRTFVENAPFHSAFRRLCSLLHRQAKLDHGSRERTPLGDSPAGTLHNQRMGVEMLGALVVPALKPGDLVLVEPNGPSAEESSTEWWIGWIMQPEGSGPVAVGSNNTFQASDCETGQLRSVKGDEATRLVLSGINSTLKQLL